MAIFLFHYFCSFACCSDPGKGHKLSWVAGNLAPRVFSLFKMAAAREKTLEHSRSRVSNEDRDVFKMAATAKRVRRTGYEMLR